MATDVLLPYWQATVTLAVTFLQSGNAKWLQVNMHSLARGGEALSANPNRYSIESSRVWYRADHDVVSCQEYASGSKLAVSLRTRMDRSPAAAVYLSIPAGLEGLLRPVIPGFEGTIPVCHGYDMHHTCHSPSILIFISRLSPLF